MLSKQSKNICKEEQKNNIIIKNRNSKKHLLIGIFSLYYVVYFSNKYFFCSIHRNLMKHH